MKAILFTIFSIAVFSCSSQSPQYDRNEYKISIEKLIDLNKMSKVDVESYLLSKHFDHKTESNADGDNCTSWGFLYGDEKTSNPTSSRVDYCVSSAGVSQGLTYWVVESQYYYDCLNEIDKLGFVLFKETHDKDGEIMKVFTSAKFKVVIITRTTHVNNGNAHLSGYAFTIMDSELAKSILSE